MLENVGQWGWFQSQIHFTNWTLSQTCAVLDIVHDSQNYMWFWRSLDKSVKQGITLTWKNLPFISVPFSQVTSRYPIETTLAISSKSSISNTSCMAWSIVYPKSCRGNGTDNCNCISWLGAARFFWGQNGPQSVRTQTEWCYLADQPFSLVPWYFFCRLCLNRFEMIQSKQLPSSFKLIIYFTFSSLMFKI